MGANQDFLDVRAGIVLFTRTILVCLLPIAMAGCGGGAGGVSNPNPFEAADDLVRIEVLNRNFADATLRALVAGARRTLGRVTGQHQQNVQARLALQPPPADRDRSACWTELHHSGDLRPTR